MTTGEFCERTFGGRFSAVGDFGARMCETLVWLLQWGVTTGNRLSVRFMANDQVRAQLVDSGLIYNTRTVQEL